MRAPHSFLPLLFLLLLGACTPSANEPETDATTAAAPVPKPLEATARLSLDEAHNALWQDSAQPYLMRPLEKIALRQADYRFIVPGEMNRPDILKKFGRTEPVQGPNVVHLLYNDNLYRTPWLPVEGEVVLDALALGGGQKSRPFKRFEHQTRVYILIGFEGPVPPGGAEAPFAPFYALRILVDQNPLRFVKQSGQVRPLNTEPTSSTTP